MTECVNGCGCELAQYQREWDLCEFCESSYVSYRRRNPELFAHLRVEWLNDRDRKFFIRDREATRDEYFTIAHAIYANL